MTWAKPPRREPTQYDGPKPTPRTIVLRARTTATLVVPLPKDPPLRSEKYRRWVSTLCCAHCGKAGPSQVAHNDGAGKGMALKSCDRFVYPLCAPTPNRAGCHHVIGSSGLFTREQRCTLEMVYSLRTQDQAKAEGHWPEGWP